MTGKDLSLVLAGALLFGGGAGALAAYLAGSGANAAPALDTELVERVKRVELALENTQRDLRQTERRRAQLEEKLTRTEIRLAGLLNGEGAADGEGPDDDTTSFVSTDGSIVSGDGKRLATDAISKALGRRKGPFQSMALTGLGSIEQFKKTAALRALPEDQRWDKAREEVRLTDGQILEIQAAIEERDGAIDAARTEEEVVTTAGTTLKKVQVDGDKIAEAEKRYQERVENVLAEDQKTAWDEGGYDRAFGSRRNRGTVLSIGGKSGGGSIMISTDFTTTSPGKDEDEKAK